MGSICISSAVVVEAVGAAGRRRWWCWFSFNQRTSHLKFSKPARPDTTHYSLLAIDLLSSCSPARMSWRSGLSWGIASQLVVHLLA